MSEADLTDSTAPKASPAATSVSTVGSSTKTASPRAWAAKAVMPTVAVNRGGRLVGRRSGRRRGGTNVRNTGVVLDPFMIFGELYDYDIPR